MKKVTCLFVAFVLSLMMIQINDARSQVMIGHGTVTGQRLPIYVYHGYSYSQVIYLASEIETSGVINSISWNFQGYSLNNSNNWTIYLGHTTKTAFNSTNDWIPIGGLTQVYSGEFASPTASGWITIPISDFTYDGTSNLVIAVDENKLGYNAAANDFFCTAVSGNRGILYSSDSNNPDPASPPTGTYLKAYIANVILGGIQQACPRVINLTATDISFNSALLGWTPLGNETLWNIEYGFKGFSLGGGTLVSGITTNPYQLTGLTPDTEYEFYVQADCGNGEVSSFTGPKVFKTLCDSYSTFPWNESFEKVTIPALPSCWYKSATSKWVVTNNYNNPYDADARTGFKFLRIRYDCTNDYVWTRAFSMEAGISYEFSFWWAGDGYSGWTGDVFMNTSQDPAGAVKIGNTFVTPDIVTDKVYRPFKYNFVPDESGDYYFAIRVSSTNVPLYLCFDDFTVKFSPSCIAPSDLTVGSITTNSALLGWTPGGSETMWNIEYGPAGFELGQGTLITGITSNPYLLSGLTSATKYDFYLQSNCGGGGLSTWFGPATFTTECGIFELPFFQDFTGVAVNTIPVCWTRTHFNWDVQYTTNAGGKKPEMRLYWSPAFTGLTLFKSPVVNTVGRTELLLEFKHYLDHYDTPYTLGVKTSSDGITWNTVWGVSPSANIAAETKEVIINNSDVGSPTFQFAFFFDGNIYNINNWYIDDIKLFANEYGTLSGYVTEATRGVIEGARVFSGSYEAFTDATGYYEIDGILAYVYDVTCEADGYVSVTEVGVEIFNNEVTELDFQLGTPNISVDPGFISATTEPGGTTIETLTISNLEGTAPLTWRAKVKPLSDHQTSLPILTQQQPKIIGADKVNPNPSGVNPNYTDEMFDFLGAFPVVDLDGTYGIVCDGYFFYTGNWQYNRFDKYSLYGEFLERFEIPGVSCTIDLTYDGEYFYGSPNNDTIYQMDFENKTLVSTIIATGSIINSISYDSDNDAFWITTDDYYGPLKLISRTGATLKTLTTINTAMSGFAYDNVSEGGPFLWAYTPVEDDQHILVKLDLTTGAAQQTFNLMPYGIFGNNSLSGGLEITNAVVPGKWTFIGCSQNDVIFVVELTDDASAWISIAPKQGVVEPGSSDQIGVNFNATNLEEGVYNASVVIKSNDPVTPQLNVPVTLLVGEYPSQDILIPLGWSGWSAYFNTNGASFENVVAPVVNDMIITQHFTEVFWPQYGINTMGNFTNNHGYVSKMSASATLSIEGMMAVPTIALKAGWNLFPILVDCNLDAAEVFGGITGFIIGYEVAGNGIYYPAGSIATLTTLVPGKAYWVKVSGAATYTFPECVKGAKASYIAPLRHTNTTPWNEPTYTGSSHIVVFNADASVSFAKGDMIGAFTNDGACAGLTLCDGKAVSLALFADDITTLVNDGFVQGESLTFKLHRQSNDTEYNLVVSYSSQAPNYDGLFEANGLSVINNVTMYATGLGFQDLTSLTVYPNPSQGLFNVSVDNHSQDVNWVVTDAKGRYVMEGRLADSHQIDLRTQPKGIYFIKFTGDNVLHIEKLVVR